MRNGVLVLNNVSKSFYHQGVHVSVLHGLQMTFRQGVRYAIMGVSGTGKSTLMHLLAGIDYPSEGMVSLDGNPVLPDNQTIRSTHIAQELGVVFQNPYLIAELSTVENVALPGLIAGHTIVDSHARAQQLLAHVGLTEKSNSKVLSLSGGQQQRVALARALYHNPTFLIADEPTGNLDEATAHMIVSLISSFCTQFGMGVIISTHDRSVAMAMDHIYTLHNGSVELVTR